MVEDNGRQSFSHNSPCCYRIWDSLSDLEGESMISAEEVGKELEGKEVPELIVYLKRWSGEAVAARLLGQQDEIKEAEIRREVSGELLCSYLSPKFV